MQESERETAVDELSRPTLAGFVLTLISVAVVFIVAYPVLRLRNPETGRPPPRIVVILIPVVAGALFQLVGTGLLRLVGLKTFTKSKLGEPIPGPDSSE